MHDNKNIIGQGKNCLPVNIKSCVEFSKLLWANLILIKDKNDRYEVRDIVRRFKAIIVKLL